MKVAILTLIGISLFFNLFSQSQKSFDSKPKGMFFVPKGSFIMKFPVNNDTVNTTVSVNAFWMSNEITNSEYRKFVRYVKEHPEEVIVQIDYASMTRNNENIKTIGNIKKYLKTVKFSEISADIIDVSKLPTNDYFTNKKYDKYPVVGISQRHATFYCKWKTKMKNDKLTKLGKASVLDYRLPTEVEWTYVATQAQTRNEKKLPGNVIHPSKSNVSNSWGLSNLFGNVSEWTLTTSGIKSGEANSGNTQKNLKIVRGGSWRTNPNIDERKVLDQNTKEDYIGFRIVCSSFENK